MEQEKIITSVELVSFLIKDRIKGFFLSRKTIKEPGKYQIDTYLLFGFIPIYRSVTVLVE